MKLLYITYIDTTAPIASGSSVRAIKMLESFRSLGADVMLLEGWNRKDQRRERSTAVLQMTERLENERPDACYVELPAGPLFFAADRQLLRHLHASGIPIAYFYGDAYWKFPQFRGAESKRSFAESLRDGLVYWAQRSCLKLYQQTARLVYFPSATMAEHFDFAQKRVSFPGCELLPDLTEKQLVSAETGTDDVMTGIYVGGVSYRYGASLLLEAFKQVNADGIKARLLVVCDPNSWQDLPSELRELEQSEWLERHTAFGDDQLRPLYERAQFACLPLRRNIYNDFAMSIKLFEYLTYGKPIVSTNCKQMAAFVEQNGIGVVSADNTAEYAAAIHQMIEDRQLYSDCLAAIVRTRVDNTWEKRARAILDDLEHVAHGK